MSAIGFIGLGRMGSHMSKNLLRHGQKLLVYDLSAARLEELKECGADVAKSPAEVASNVKEIFTMLPESDHVRSVFCDKDGILRSIKPGTLCIDTSTIDQKVSIELAELVRKKDSEYIDAPVSGGVVGAENATLTFMVGGSDVAFKRACELLKHMGKTFTHCGKVGDGQAAKICNNMLLGITMIGVSEAMNLGIRMGLDKKLLASIINSSSGRCWSSDTYNPVPGIIDGLPSSKDYTGGFACALMAKDLGLAQTAAVSTRSPIPLGSLAHQMYRILSKKSGDKDMGYVYKMLSDEQ